MWYLTESNVIAENGQKHETYGIAKGGTIINDISLGKQEICQLVELLNLLDASEIHAYEIVEDFLGK